jgi:hypothetical protein
VSNDQLPFNSKDFSIHDPTKQTHTVTFEIEIHWAREMPSSIHFFEMKDHPSNFVVPAMRFRELTARLPVLLLKMPYPPTKVLISYFNYFPFLDFETISVEELLLFFRTNLRLGG